MAAPERWDEACFAVPAVRALVASGLGAGVLCPAAQREFWETVEGLTVIAFPVKAKPRAVAAELSGNWEASLAWETGLAAEAALTLAAAGLMEAGREREGKEKRSRGGPRRN